MRSMFDIPYLAYQFAERHDIYRIATCRCQAERSQIMIASFALIFVAFAACQAVLTVKFADILSPAADKGRTIGSARNVGAAKLA